ncbi:MAG: hypothetical protein ABJO54_15545, partial [Hyphomicrobiales bacterium]
PPACAAAAAAVTGSCRVQGINHHNQRQQTAAAWNPKMPMSATSRASAARTSAKRAKPIVFTPWPCL